ncbi:hypothetical protein V6N13_041208 [Hibiscus sabdariffa]
MCSTGSRLWRGLEVIWNNVRNNLTWNVGDGQSISFWHDTWVPGYDPLSNYFSADLATSLPSACLANMVTNSSEWNWNLFQHLLPLPILLRIASIKSPFSLLMANSMGWKRRIVVS